MKIGYLLRTFPQLSETFVVKEITKLREMGHDVQLAAVYRPGEGIHPSLANLAAETRYWHDIDKSLLPHILQAHFKRIVSAPGRYAKAMGRWIPDKGLIWAVKAAFVAETFAAEGVEHLHTHFAWEQVDALRFIHDITGIPYSLTVHAADIFSELYRLKEALTEAVFVVTISEYNRKFLMDNYGVSARKCHVVHCGVEPDRFADGSMPFSGDKPKILTIGRMVKKKGFDTLIKAVGEMKASGVDVDLNLIGDGPLMADLTRLAENLAIEDRVRFMGALPHDAVRQELMNCDVFALACRPGGNGDMDGIPVVLMEAMAAGRPTVSTRLSGIPELIREGAGLLVDPEDVSGLAASIRQLVAFPEKARTMGAAAIDIVGREFSLQAQAEGLLRRIREYGRGEA